MNSPVQVILGASGGIGSALARKLAAEGHRLILAGRSGDRLASLAEELGVESQVIDATRFKDVESCIEQSCEKYGRVDGVVNCVGSLILKPAHLTTEQEWANTISANLTSSFATVRAAARFMMKTGGSVVLISSAAARLGLANHEAIAAAKAGICGLVLSAATTYAARNIRVNAVAPGLVRTPLTERITSSESATKASLSMHALGRLGEAHEVADLIRYLLSNESGWVTGQIFGIDGGLANLRARAAG